MKIKFLLPKHFNKIGWVLAIPTIFLGAIWPGFDHGPEFLKVQVYSLMKIPFNNTSNGHMVENNLFDEIIGIGLIIGLFFIAFSKVKNEDELITRLRMESLIWALYWNYGILIAAMIFIYDLAFFNVMLWNMFLILILFIIRFKYFLYKLNKG